MTKQTQLRWLKILLLAGVYFGAAKFGLSLAFTTQQVTSIWPPTGIALAALLLFGFDLWPGIFIGALVANLSTQEPVLVALGIAAGNTLEGVIGAYLLTNVSRIRHSLDRLRDVLALIFFGAMINTAFSATIGVLSLGFGGLISWADYGGTWTTWWVGDMIGGLLVAPLILVWFDAPARRAIRSRLFEASFLTFFIVAANLFIFNGPLREEVMVRPLPYLIAPFIIWAGLRFRLIGAITATVITSSIAVWSTLHNVGPFASRAPTELNLIALQIFTFVLAATALVLAAIISERERAREKLSFSEQHFRALIENSYEAIALIDAYGVISYASESTQRVLGYTPAEFINRSGFALVHPEDVGQTKQALQEVVDHPRTLVTFRARIKHQNDSWVWVETTITNLLTEPAVGAIVVNYRDITKEREVDMAKSEFISLASHQLRTPLSTINWYIEALLKEKIGAVNEKQRRYLEQVEHSNKRLIAITNDLLNISRIELGTFIIEPVNADLRSVADGSLAIFEHEIARKKLKVSKKYDTDLPLLSADLHLLELIFENLISNAVKYTPEKGLITITIEARKSNIFFSVADTGLGIPENAHSQVFSRFFRGNNIKAVDTTGAGLGLYIVKQVIDAVGGDITFKSKEGSGTTFSVSLPLSGMNKKGGKVILNTLP